MLNTIAIRYGPPIVSASLLYMLSTETFSTAFLAAVVSALPALFISSVNLSSFVTNLFRMPATVVWLPNCLLRSLLRPAVSCFRVVAVALRGPLPTLHAAVEDHQLHCNRLPPYLYVLLYSLLAYR